MHNWPSLKTGSFAVREGPLLASNNDFRITIKGCCSHAAMPHLGHDPLLAAAQLVTALQSIITRNKKPFDTAVLPITQFRSGTASNVVPDSVWIDDTVHTCSNQVLDLIESQMAQMCKSITWACDCTVDVKFSRNYPATVNSRRVTGFALEAIRSLVGDQMF